MSALHDKKAKWFDETVEVPPQARELLEKYSGIPGGKIVDTAIALRNKAWDVWPYPCSGQFRFLELNLAARGKLYEQLLARLRAGGKFLDVGCCLGQDIRKLVFDGAPGENLVGAELNAGFIELGYELFRDRGTLGAKFLVANILDDEGPLNELKHTFDVVQLGMILHLFFWDEQLVVFKHAIAMLKAEKGALMIGQATGHLDGAATAGWRGETFKHNVETFERLIEHVSAETGTQWNVKAELDNGLSVFDGKRTWESPKTRRLLFELERLE